MIRRKTLRRMMRAYEHGQSLDDIALWSRYSRSYIHRLLKQKGVKMRCKGQRRMEGVEDAAMMFSEGMHPDKIGEHLTLSTTAVKRRLAAAGIRQEKKRKFSAEDVIRYRQAWAEKRMTVGQVADEHRVDWHTAKDMLEGLTYKWVGDDPRTER